MRDGLNGELTAIGRDLTKYPSPLIIIMVVGRVMPTGERGKPYQLLHSEEVMKLRIHLKKRTELGTEVLVLPSRRLHRAPETVHVPVGDHVAFALAPRIEELDTAEREARTGRGPRTG